MSTSEMLRAEKNEVDQVFAHRKFYYSSIRITNKLTLHQQRNNAATNHGELITFRHFSPQNCFFLQDIFYSSPQQNNKSSLIMMNKT